MVSRWCQTMREAMLEASGEAMRQAMRLMNADKNRKEELRQEGLFALSSLVTFSNEAVSRTKSINLEGKK